MKRIVILLVAVLLLPGLSKAQGNDKSKDKEKNKTKTNTNTNSKSNGSGNGNADVKVDKSKDKSDKEKHQTAIWGGTTEGPKPSKNQPAKVRSAFTRDYPNASGVTWSKYKGDWTATFRNGPYWSTAVYHANGDRKDTRTQIPVIQLPGKIEDIFKKKPETKVEDVVKIETPAMKQIFRLKTILDGKTKYQYVNEAGVEVTYNY
jgi:leucyl aminopeptidase (aminopeptidase T)